MIGLPDRFLMVSVAVTIFLNAEGLRPYPIIGTNRPRPAPTDARVGRGGARPLFQLVKAEVAARAFQLAAVVSFLSSWVGAGAGLRCAEYAPDRAHIIGSPRRSCRRSDVPARVYTYVYA